jgi:predicted alpha/beta-fold hydrolase
MSSSRVPSFEPHSFLPTGHLQTILSRYLPGPKARLKAIKAQIRLEDGDQVVVFDSIAPGWSPGRPMALLVHGLGGDASGIALVKLGSRLV